MLGAAALAALARVARQRFPRMRIFLVTGYTERLDEIERQGFPVLAKPFNVQQLLEALSAGQVSRWQRRTLSAILLRAYRWLPGAIAGCLLIR